MVSRPSPDYLKWSENGSKSGDLVFVAGNPGSTSRELTTTQLAYVSLFGRATDASPYALPQSWLAAKSSLDLSTPMNLSTTNDIIGGNSGSPLVDTGGDVVGLIFDGNVFSLGGDFGYDGVRNRAVAVDSRALLAGLQHVYHADRLVTEIETARN